MMLRVLGALLVVLAGGVTGYFLSGREIFRIQDLSSFKKALLILASEIEYLKTPLSEACLNIAKRTDKPVSNIFEEFAGLLTEEGVGAGEVWARTVAANRKRTFLTEEDVNVLESFGKTLGYLDAQMQLNSIAYVTDYIEGKINSLREQSDRNKRMYRSLGWIGGGLIAVVLW
jgi:stage III sporulation protein AB